LNRAAPFLLLGLCAYSTLAAAADRTFQQRVDAIFAPYNNTASPGCAVGIVQDGNFVYKRGYGMGSIELQSPLSPESVFYMGSVSKQFTAASVVLAAEQGYLSLDDDIRRWIPEIPFYGHKITLRLMLHHMSGLRDEIGLLSLAGDPIENIHTVPETIDLIARQKALNFTPGDEYQYSNSSVDDLLLWDRNFYDNKPGKGTLLRELQTRGVLNNGKTINYALGLELTDYQDCPWLNTAALSLATVRSYCAFLSRNFL